MKKQEIKALRILDEKIKQFKKILNETSVDDIFTDEYGVVYNETEIFLTNLFSKEDVNEYLKNTTYVGHPINDDPSIKLERHKNNIKRCITQLEKIKKKYQESREEKKTDMIDVDKIKNLPDWTIKKNIIKLLESNIKNDKFNINGLTFTGLKKKIDIEDDRLQKILDELKRDKLSTKKSGIELYIPKDYQKHQNLKFLKLSNPYRLLLSYFVGLAAIIIAYKSIPFLGTKIVEFFGTLLHPDAIIATGFLFGFFLPLLIGFLIYGIGQRIFNILSTKLNVDVGASITIFGTMFIILLCYLLPQFYFNQPTPIESIILIAGVGFGIGCGVWEFILKPKKSRIDLRNIFKR